MDTTTGNDGTTTLSGCGQYRKEADMRNPEALIAERESSSAKRFPISGKELLARLERLYTGAGGHKERRLLLRVWI